MHSPKKTRYPSLNEILVLVRSALPSAATNPSGRTRGSLQIQLDARRARRGNLPG